jgi:acyl carrier protein
MLDHIDIRMIINAYLAEKIGTENKYTNLISGQKLDSLSILNLILYVESTFKIKISVTERRLENFDSSDRIVDLVRLKLGVST